MLYLVLDKMRTPDKHLQDGQEVSGRNFMNVLTGGSCVQPTLQGIIIFGLENSVPEREGLKD